MIIWCAMGLAAQLAAARAAAEEEIGAPIALDEVRGGSLLFGAGQPGRFVQAPALQTDIAIWVAGLVARAQVTQRFVNPTDQWLEGVYAFPLPETAAVDHLRLFVGSRVIEGQIREREEAQRVYQQAKADGCKASLVEQERPNLFTTSVANIGPGETVEVAIEYQEILRYDGGEFALRVPLVVAPRYIPGGPDSDGGPASPAVPFPQVPDADRLAAPVHCGPEPINPVTLAIELDAGFPLRMLYSPSHAIKTVPVADTVQLVMLADGEVPADRDFILVWAPGTGRLPEAALFTEVVGGATYALLMVLPPDPTAPAPRRIARETIFVIDTSGSMAGGSIDQAKVALLIALDQLQPGDRFNVIQFNSTTDRLFADSVRAEPDAVDRARRYVEGLEATGGTEMRPALEAALAGAAASGEVRQVIFMTDGAVGNEAALFAYLAEHLGDSRLFTVGIGSAPNAFFMRKAAQFGRGTFTSVGTPQELSTRMDELFRRLESPQLTDLAVTWDDPDVEMWPAAVPDLYAGEPVVVVARLAAASESLFVSGNLGREAWQVDVAGRDAESSPDGAGIAQLWAHRKIDALMDSVVAGADRAEVRRAVVELALDHHLVTSYTSLVAVDVTPTAPAGTDALAYRFPVNPPHGWRLGALPSTATPAPLYALLAALCLLCAIALRPLSFRVCR